MITELKLSSHEAYLHWNQLESERLKVYDECRDDVPKTCYELNKCWDGSDRNGDYPTCSCSAWDWNRVKCGQHDCPAGYTLS